MRPLASWDIDAEPIRARGIIVNYIHIVTHTVYRLPLLHLMEDHDLIHIKIILRSLLKDNPPSPGKVGHITGTVVSVLLQPPKNKISESAVRRDLRFFILVWVLAKSETHCTGRFFSCCQRLKLIIRVFFCREYSGTIKRMLEMQLGIPVDQQSLLGWASNLQLSDDVRWFSISVNWQVSQEHERPSH